MSKYSKRLIVTGGAGFIGSNFLRHMLKKYPDYEFVNLDKLTYAGNLNTISDLLSYSNYSFIKGDICDKEKLDSIVKEGDIIINFAAESHVDNSISGPLAFTETNVKGTHILLEVAREKKISLFIQISTDEVYGSLNSDSPSSKESDLLMPSSPYSSSKAAAEMISLSYYRTFNLPVIITRSSNNFGPYQFPEKVIPLFVTNLIDNKSVPLYGTGKNIRDWIYVLDNCEAIDFIIHNGKIGEVYNIGGGNEVNNLDLTKIVLNSFGLDEKSISYVKDRLGHDLRYSLNCEKIKSLGWKPRFSFKESLDETISWYKQNRLWWEPLKNKIKENKCLIIGNGFFGNRFKEYLGNEAVLSDKKIKSENDVLELIEKYKPEIVINCAGFTGNPNVDACENQKKETWHGNVELPYIIANACSKKGVRMVHLSSGCIFDGTREDGSGFREEDNPNFYGSYYSKTKLAAEILLGAFDNVLIVRPRIPLEGRRNKRNLIDKLLSYSSKGYPILSTKNSITHVPDFLRITKILMDKKSTGIFNVVNEGTMTHDQLLAAYEEISGKKLNYKTINADELNSLTLAKRSNCTLSVEKLKSLGIEVPSVESAIKNAVESYVLDGEK